MATSRTCPTCGTPASATERFCANCGTRLSDTLPPAGVEPTQPLPPPSAPGSTASQGGLGLPPVVPDAPAPRKGLPIWAVVLMALGGLCAVGCVASFFVLNLLGQRVSEVFATTVVELTTAEPEPSAETGGIVPTFAPIPTRPPASTAEATRPTSGAGGGIVGGTAGSAASQAQTVQAAQTSQTAQTELEQLFATAREVFREEFVDNSNAWATGVISDIETDTIEDGVIKIAWTGRGTTYEPWVERELTNFIADTDCIVQQGGTDGSCGLVFSLQEGTGFYSFDVYPDYYSLVSVPADGDTIVLAEGDPAAFYRAGDWNRLRVIKQGPRIRAYLNNILLADVSDERFPTGRVGISSGSFNEAGGVEVWLDNFVIWELP